MIAFPLRSFQERMGRISVYNKKGGGEEIR